MVTTLGFKMKRVLGNRSLQKVGFHVVDPSIEYKQSSVLIGLCCCFIVVQMFVSRRKIV